MMPSLGSRCAEMLVRLFLRPPATSEAGERAVQEAALRPAAFGPPKRIRRDVIIQHARMYDWPTYTVSPAARSCDTALIYIHGGAFYGEITAFHWRLIARICAETSTKVTVPIYPLVPRGTAADAIDTIAAIATSEVERLGAGGVSLAGDSAGGAIAMAVALQLSKAGLSLRQTLLLHPIVDLTLSNPEISIVERRDPILRAAALRPILERWKGALDMRDPRVSPLFGDFYGLGPLTVFSGTHDITNPDTRLLVNKARAAGVRVAYHEGEGLIHASLALPTREGRDGRRLIIESLR